MLTYTIDIYRYHQQQTPGGLFRGYFFVVDPLLVEVDLFLFVAGPLLSVAGPLLFVPGPLLFVARSLLFVARSALALTRSVQHNMAQSPRQLIDFALVIG